jgi:16S rRNA processing protein RimM
MATQPSYLIAAKIVAPFGIRGEVKAELWTDFPDRLASRSTVFLGREDDAPREYTLRGIRFHQRHALLSLAGCEDRTTAESLRGLLVQIPAADVPPLPAGSYYLHQIIGLQVWGSDGQPYGTITEVLAMASNDVYVVEGERGQILVPAIPDFVRQVDLDHGRLIVEMSGLL